MIGLDIAEKRLREAAAKPYYRACVHGSVYALPFRDQSLDVVVSSVMVGLTGPRSVAEMWRVLKPGGVLGIALGEIKYMRWSQDRFTASLRRIRSLKRGEMLVEYDLGTGYSKNSYEYEDEHYVFCILRKIR